MIHFSLTKYFHKVSVLSNEQDCNFLCYSEFKNTINKVTQI